MPLVIAPANKLLTVVKILVSDREKKHLESLGITINSAITVLSSNGGNVICRVKDGRLALDKGIATKIMVV